MARGRRRECPCMERRGRIRKRACEKRESRSKLPYTIEIKFKTKSTLGRKAYRHRQAILIIQAMI